MSTKKFYYIVLALQLITLTVILIHDVDFQTPITDEESESFRGTSAIIPIRGEIVVNAEDSLFPPSTISDQTVPMIEKASEDPSIKSIILDINSWGGSSVASDEIVRAIKATNKTTVAWIRESGTSAAYKIASASDWIIANERSDVGSIGIITQYEIYNVTYETIKSGKYKDILTDNRLLTDDERKIIQEQTDLLHKIFVEDVATNRGMDPKAVEALANGLSWPGVAAKELGLVDELGSKKEVIRYIRDQTGEEPILAYYNKETQAFDLQTAEDNGSD